MVLDAMPPPLTGGHKTKLGAEVGIDWLDMTFHPSPLIDEVQPA